MTSTSPILSHLLCRLGTLLLLSLQSILAEEVPWMKAIPAKTPLSLLTIPGTHNSGALHEPLQGTAKCQSLNIEEQLFAGVRFLDIRCRHQRNKFHIYHVPIDQKLSFTECLKSIENYLANHPSETVIVSIKEEHRAAKTTRSFLQTFERYLKPEHWWLFENISLLSEARGKIIRLRRFTSRKTLGIPATNWQCKERHETAPRHRYSGFYDR